jgi:hypothetical protein
MASGEPPSGLRKAGLRPAELPLREPMAMPQPPTIHEHGITVLFEPDNASDIVADIVFVHGLGGHPRKTWRYGKADGDQPTSSQQKTSRLHFFKSLRNSKDGEVQQSSTNSPSCYWPFDLLSKDFGNIRVMTYGYDSKPSHFYSGPTVKMNIAQHTNQLLQSVTHSRTECRGRPVIFAAHSLGGILVKDAIVLSTRYQQQPTMKDVASSCRAVFFFGTPHHGADAAAYGDILASIVSAIPFSPSTNRQILKDLQPDSQKLSEVTAGFNDLLDQNIQTAEKIQIYSFREGLPMTKLARFDGKVMGVPDQSIDLADTLQIVPDGSAFFNRRDIEQSSMIMENHRNMCKFKDSRSAGYICFKAALEGYLEAIQSRRSVSQTPLQPAALEGLLFNISYCS